VRISSIPVRPGLQLHPQRESFHVHADVLELAPVGKNQYGKQPTMAAVERKEREKAGIRDIGDPVAELLRKATCLDEAYRITAEAACIPVDELRAKYGHLNPGQQRMNLGNKLRNLIKKGKVTL
jgi:hypothetical protein